MSTITKLWQACRDGHDQEVKTILSRGEVDVNITEYNDWTPLNYAMEYNHHTIVTMLLARADTRLDVANCHGDTGLHYACYKNSASCISVYGEDRRCSTNILNMKNNYGNTPVMAAVLKGHLDCVREMGKLPGVDFDTKNNKEETLIAVARRNNHLQIVQFLDMRAAQVGKNASFHVANSNNLDSMSLKEIAEELDSIEEIDAVMQTEKDILNDTHKEEITNLRSLHRDEMTGLERKIEQNKTRQDNLKRIMQDRLTSTTSSASSAFKDSSTNIPECPACLEEMRPPLQIFNCRNGHLVCSNCRPRVSNCTMCRQEYTGRATAVEQMIRQIIG